MHTSGRLLGTHLWSLTEQLEVTSLSTAFKQGFLANAIRLQIKMKQSSTKIRKEETVLSFLADNMFMFT